MGVDLTNGAIERICSDSFRGDNKVFHPVLQIIDTGDADVCLSDGTHHIPAEFLAMLQCDLLETGRFQIGSIVKINEFYVCSGSTKSVLPSLTLMLYSKNVIR